MSPKISLIGAGSGVFSLSLIRDLCLTENLAGSTNSFMDIHPERLEGSLNALLALPFHEAMRAHYR